MKSEHPFDAKLMQEAVIEGEAYHVYKLMGLTARQLMKHRAELLVALETMVNADNNKLEWARAEARTVIAKVLSRK